MLSKRLLRPIRTAKRHLRSLAEEVYDLSESSHVVKLITALCGDSGVGSVRKALLVKRLSTALDTTQFSDLDRFFGQTLRFPRLREEQYDLAPMSGLLTQAQWDEVYIKDARYRARIQKYLRAFQYGGSLEGIRLAAEAGCGEECVVYPSRWYYEQYGVPDGSTESALLTSVGSRSAYSEVEVGLGSSYVASLAPTSLHPTAPVSVKEYGKYWTRSIASAGTGNSNLVCGERLIAGQSYTVEIPSYARASGAGTLNFTGNVVGDWIDIPAVLTSHVCMEILSVVVRSTNWGGTTYVEGKDYAIDRFAKKIKRLSGGAITATTVYSRETARYAASSVTITNTTTPSTTFWSGRSTVVLGGYGVYVPLTKVLGTPTYDYIAKYIDSSSVAVYSATSGGTLYTLNTHYATDGRGGIAPIDGGGLTATQTVYVTWTAPSLPFLSISPSPNSSYPYTITATAKTGSELAAAGYTIDRSTATIARAGSTLTGLNVLVGVSVPAVDYSEVFVVPLTRDEITPEDIRLVSLATERVKPADVKISVVSKADFDGLFPVGYWGASTPSPEFFSDRVVDSIESSSDFFTVNKFVTGASGWTVEYNPVKGYWVEPNVPHEAPTLAFSRHSEEVFELASQVVDVQASSSHLGRFDSVHQGMFSHLLELGKDEVRTFPQSAVRSRAHRRVSAPYYGGRNA